MQQHRHSQSQTNRMWRKQNALGWIQKIIARMLRTSPMNIPRSWLLRPDFCLWPPQRQRSVLCLLSRYVNFTLCRRGKQDPQDVMGFLRRSRWKTQQMPGRRKLLANFLTCHRYIPILNPNRKGKHSRSESIYCKTQFTSRQHNNINYNSISINTQLICYMFRRFLSHHQAYTSRTTVFYFCLKNSSS